MFPGFGYHGDVIVAWDEGVLDAATKQCGPDSKDTDVGHNGETEKCPVFTMNPVEDQKACKIELPPMLESDVITGSVQNLPGKVAITSGPDYAKPGGSDAAPAQKVAVKPNASASSVDNGNVFKASDSSSTSTSTSSSASSTVADSYSSSSSSSPPAAVPTTSSTSAPPPPAAVTPAPAVPANNADVANIQLSTITTSWYTKGQEAYEVVVVAEEVTVTVGDAGATPAPGAKAKRDFLHRHGRRHGHHGGIHQ